MPSDKLNNHQAISGPTSPGPKIEQFALTGSNKPMVLSMVEKKLINLLSGDLGGSLRPYESLAQRLGLTEEKVLLMIDDMIKRRVIRRLGAVVVHQRSGFAANAMVVWDVAEDQLDDAGKTLAEKPFVSHCYHRPQAPGWPFNLYTMIHARTPEELAHMVDNMSSLIKASGHKVLTSLRELKKISPLYFPGAQK
ncbi:MAG: Lrp/AsnC family transcriptional regulator [Deltaproteobacteria bacterium]|nr:Lrp/AsnC family transcriptional regulator [Deltaproteobacteria bacterium]